MKFGRYKQKISLTMSTPNISDILEKVRQFNKTELRNHLGVRVKEDGRIKVRLHVAGRYIPPNLKGRFIIDKKGLKLQGVVRESKAEALYPLIYLFLTLFMTLVFVFMIIQQSLDHGLMLIINGGGAAVFALLTYWMNRTRYDRFTQDGVKLLDSINQHLLQMNTDEPVDYYNK